MKEDAQTNKKKFRSENSSFPTTRYQGSKRDLIDWIWSAIEEHVQFESTLDAFGGTGAFAYKSKKENKDSYYNDYLRFNYHIGRAIVENKNTVLKSDDVDFLMDEHDRFDYPNFIQHKFDGLYFTEEENAWLDRMKVHIDNLDNEYKKSIAVSTLAQCCLAKRPYNLFHRANLYMRKEDVDRSFGNKKTWEKSFEKHFRQKCVEYNKAVFSTDSATESYNKDVLNWEDPPSTDLVYLDPPYYDRTKSNSTVDYKYFYHFLEGFLQYDQWEDMIDESVKTNKIDDDNTAWKTKENVRESLEIVFDKFSDRVIVMSYNRNGYPQEEDLRSMLSSRKDNVKVVSKNYTYALKTGEDSPDEILVIAYDDSESV